MNYDIGSPARKPRRRWLRKSLIIIGGTIVTVLGTGFIHALPQIYGLNAVLSTKTTTVKVQIADLILAIPRNIIDFPPETRKPDQAISLIALWPTLEGRSETNVDEFMKVRGQGRRIRILVEDISGQTSFIYRYEIRRRFLGHITWNIEAFGLVRGTQTMTQDERPIQAGEMYIEGQADSPTSFIECDPEGVVPMPGCSHFFMHRGLLFQISYGKPFLPDWKEIQRRVISMFDGLVQSKL
jgi:hypothetical protein